MTSFQTTLTIIFLLAAALGGTNSQEQVQQIRGVGLLSEDDSKVDAASTRELNLIRNSLNSYASDTATEDTAIEDATEYHETVELPDPASVTDEFLQTQTRARNGFGAQRGDGKRVRNFLLKSDKSEKSEKKCKGNKKKKGKGTKAPWESVDCPTEGPTAPTVAPTNKPTTPTVPPTNQPTLSPTADPTSTPTAPTTAPTSTPTAPTVAPTNQPTLSPTTAPTNQPTLSPNAAPTSSPTETFQPSATFQPSSTFAPSTFIPTQTFTPTTSRRLGAAFAAIAEGRLDRAERNQIAKRQEKKDRIDLLEENV